MTAIRIYWWNGGPGHGNFGDSLGPMICEQLAKRPVRHASLQEADLISIGSVRRQLVWPSGLEPRFWGNHLNRTYQGCIWGAGRMFGNVKFRLPLADIRAVRGELTRKTLSPSQQRSAISGEPGLLAPLLPATVAEPRKRYKVGVIPHWTEVSHPKIRWLAQLSAEVLVIDPTEHVNTILDRIRSCDSILSSAMHGLVVADSFGIPNHWLRLHTGREGRDGLPEFKFRDYFSLYGQSNRAYFKVSREQRFENIVEAFEVVQPQSRESVEPLQRRLMAAFPF